MGLRIAIVSLGPAGRVSRLKRFLTALQGVGYETWLLAGRDPGSARLPEETRVPGRGGMLLADFKVSTADRLRYRTHRIIRGLLARLPGSLWRMFESCEPEAHIMRAHLRDLDSERDSPISQSFDVVIGHALGAMPLASQLARRTGARLVYDVTELFSEQYAYSSAWRLLERPFILHQERQYCEFADAMITPCPAYLEHVMELYGVTSRTAIVRNTMETTVGIAATTVAAKKASDEPVTVIYQGLALPNRGLETYIGSVCHWPLQARLVLQLLGSNNDVARLEGEIEGHGLGNRIEIVPPAEATAQALIASISKYEASIGLCCFDPAQLQVRYSQPNKLHTYMASGLAIVAIEGTETGDIVRQHGLGKTAAEFSSKCLANSISTLIHDQKELAACGERALALARDWSWSNEQKCLTDVVASLGHQRVV